MVEKAPEGNRFNWWLPLYAAVGALVAFVLVAATMDYDISFILYTFIVTPIISSALLVIAIRKKRQRLSRLSMLVVYLVISGILARHYDAVRPATRWLLWSHRYKAEVLVQQASANGELKHIEWEGWGFPGAGNNTVYLVFDPTDSLSAAAKSHSPGKFTGVPCKVPHVRRLESRWYSVQFYTDEYWGRCNEGGANGR